MLKFPDDAACRSFMRSLDPRNISNGAAEILKMACIKDETLFDVLYDHAEQLRSSSFQVRCNSLPPLCSASPIEHTFLQLWLVRATIIQNHSREQADKYSNTSLEQ